ncbi:MAG: OmpA family protein [Candidatus Electrothrix sp. GW3-4]|uniref:OmpA family protein n=1 Tax=Candidatus Electrothrix sp. GW3-4 TaxID=3126740 RepID=UPI0030D17B5E
MLKKRAAVLCGAAFSVILLFAKGSFAEEEEVKSAKDLIMELAPLPPAEPVRRTRGLVPRPVASPSATPVQAVQTAPAPTGFSTLTAVQFVYDSDELLPVAKRQLDQLVIALQDVKLRHSRIQLIGHTDAAGSREYNRNLSVRRAHSAARYLVQVHGIPAQRIIPIGMGEDQLLDPYNPLSAINRRVEVVVVN